MVIVTHIWQKLSSVEREMALIATNFWQLFSAHPQNKCVCLLRQ